METRPLISTDFRVRACSPELFGRVQELVSAFELDNREMRPGQFITVCDNDGLCGFIRTWDHGSFSEMCTLGIVPEKRGQGLAHLLVDSILAISTYPIYIVTIMPQFFLEYGFVHCAEYPEAIRAKLSYCVNDLPVEEQYVVMMKS